MNPVRFAKYVHRRSPIDMRRFLGPLYYRYLSHSATREHTLPASSLDVSTNTDHVLIVTIDALRPDYTPSLPLNFNRAIAPSTWTFPSVTSILSGQLPHQHRAVAHTHPDDDHYVTPEQATLGAILPETLERYGFDTHIGAAFITPFLALRGWFTSHRVYGDVRAESVIEDYLSWRNGKERTFGYLHLGDLHAPIEPPTRYVERHEVNTSIDELESLTRFTSDFSSPEAERFREERLKLYEAALEYVEDQLRPLVEDFSDDTLIVVTGDHGEAMWEHHEIDKQFSDSRPNYGVGHGGTPLDMVARVPVAVSHPYETPIPQRGSLRDLPQTILDGLGVDTEEFPGKSWFEGSYEDRYFVCEGGRYGSERKAVYHEDGKIIHSKTDGITLDARVDENSGESFGELSEKQIGLLKQHVPDAWEEIDLATETDAMVEDQLKSLGYM